MKADAKHIWLVESCNGVGGLYTVGEEGKIAVTEESSLRTTKDCLSNGINIGDLEKELQEVINNSEIKINDDSITIVSESGVLIFRKLQLDTNIPKQPTLDYQTPIDKEPTTPVRPTPVTPTPTPVAPTPTVEKPTDKEPVVETPIGENDPGLVDEPELGYIIVANKISLTFSTVTLDGTPPVDVETNTSPAPEVSPSSEEKPSTVPSSKNPSQAKTEVKVNTYVYYATTASSIIVFSTTS